MTTPDKSTEKPKTGHKLRLGQDDPLLQELWTAKAAFNAEAGHAVDMLAEQANQFDLEEAMARLRHQIAH